MIKITPVVASAAVLCGSLGPANAWFHGGGTTRFGGHYGAAGSYGDWHAGGVTATGHAWGAAGSGSAWHGASTSGVHAGGYDGHWAASGPNGHWATGTRWGGAAYGGAYHPPAVVNHYYGAGGCYGCGGWSAAGAAAGGAAVGLVAGAAIGAAAATAAAPGYVVGTTYAALPPGCAYNPLGGIAYYTCAGTWFQPYYGANGTSYRVVPVP